MKKRVMVPLADGFEEIEAFTIVDVLRRAGIETDTVSIRGSVVQSSHGIRVMVDTRIDMIDPDTYNAIVLPGGSPGYVNLGKSSKLIEILKKFNNQGKLIAAICGAPLILAEHGLLDDKRATVYPGFERKLSYPRGNKVVVDGNIITSQGPGTAMEFALKVVEMLVGRGEAMRLRNELVVD